MNIDNIIQEEILLFENKQLADKLYFNTGKLNDEDKKIIYNITNGDNTTKAISDIYFEEKDHNWRFNDVIKTLKIIHDDLLSYNANVFPIKDFDMYNSKNINGLYWILTNRHKILLELYKLPSQAIRNLKMDIRQPRDAGEMDHYRDAIEYFNALYSQLGNRDSNAKKKIENKMFKSNTTMDDLNSFADEKENLLGGVEYTRDFIEQLITDSQGDMNIYYNKNNVMVVRVYDADAIKKIGCNSLWCFTYGINNYKNWNDYSYNGMVYVIINFNSTPDDSDFMHVLIKPLRTPKFYSIEDNDNEIPLFNMANENFYNPYSELTSIMGKMDFRKFFNFKYQ